MSIKASVGSDYGSDPYAVGAKACQEAFDKLKEATADVAIVFSSVEYDQERMLAGVRSVSKDALVIGTSTAGEITTEGPLGKRSVAVMLIASDTIKFYGGIGEGISKGARDAGKRAADAVKAQAEEGLKAFMMFPDVLVGNGAETVRGVLDSLGEHFPVVGGASGDDFKFVKTYQYLSEKVYSGAVAGLGLSGNFRIGIGVKHGWLPIGTSFKVTKSEGSVLHELNGKPAIKIYEDYFGEEEAKQLKIDTLAKLAITYPLGSEIQLMIGSREEAIKVAKSAAENAVAQLDGGIPKAVIIFNCIARNKLFGDRSGEEINAIQEAIGKDVPLIGFYTYGEQAPLGGEVRNIEKCNPAFHNETVVIVVLAES